MGIAIDHELAEVVEGAVLGAEDHGASEVVTLVNPPDIRLGGFCVTLYGYSSLIVEVGAAIKNHVATQVQIAIVIQE